MERKIVTVGPEEFGWRIDILDRKPIPIADFQKAIVMACDLARTEHRATGKPTAVKVRMNCGDGIMMGFCG